MAESYPHPESLLVGLRGVAQPFDSIFVQTVSITPASVANAVTAEQTFSTFTKLKAATDFAVLVNAPARTNSTLIGSVRVSADSTLAVNYVNPTAGALTPPSGNYTILVFRKANNPAL